MINTVSKVFASVLLGFFYLLALLMTIIFVLTRLNGGEKTNE